LVGVLLYEPLTYRASPSYADRRASLFGTLGIEPRPVDGGAVVQSDNDICAEYDFEELLSTGAAVVSPHNPLCIVPVGMDRCFDEHDSVSLLLETDTDDTGDPDQVLSLDSILGSQATMEMNGTWSRRSSRLSIKAAVRLPNALAMPAAAEI